jgi:hypothetical protein
MENDPLYQQWPDLGLHPDRTLQTLDDYVRRIYDKFSSKETASGWMLAASLLGSEVRASEEDFEDESRMN